MSTIQYEREISQTLVKISKQFPALVLTGARQTGKTTLLSQLFPHYNYVTLDVPAIAAQAENDPEEFLRRYPTPLLIDEVQYAPKLFRHLKVVIDIEKKNSLYILTGSQKFALMKEVSDSLAGRCAVFDLESFSIFELGKVFEQYRKEKSRSSILARGFYPHLWKDLNNDSVYFHSSYLATYIERDVRQIINITSLRDFDRFMRACATRSGQLLNKSDLAKDVGISVDTVTRWISVLEASNQISLLEPYFNNINKRLVKSPKLFFNDTGLLCYLLGLTEQTIANSYMLGAIWETFVYAEMRKSLTIQPQAKIWFYRDQSVEIDFLFEKSGNITMFEAKWTEYPESKVAEHMRTIAKLLNQPVIGKYVVCGCPSEYPLSNDTKAINGFELSELLRK